MSAVDGDVLERVEAIANATRRADVHAEGWQLVAAAAELAHRGEYSQAAYLSSAASSFVAARLLEDDDLTAVKAAVRAERRTAASKVELDAPIPYSLIPAQSKAPELEGPPAVRRKFECACGTFVIIDDSDDDPADFYAEVVDHEATCSVLAELERVVTQAGELAWVTRQQPAEQPGGRSVSARVDEAWYWRDHAPDLDRALVERMARQEVPRSTRMLGGVLLALAVMFVLVVLGLVLATTAQAAEPGVTVPDPGAWPMFAVLGVSVLVGGAVAFRRRS